MACKRLEFQSCCTDAWGSGCCLTHWSNVFGPHCSGVPMVIPSADVCCVRWQKSASSSFYQAYSDAHFLMNCIELKGHMLGQYFKNVITERVNHPRVSPICPFCWHRCPELGGRGPEHLQASLCVMVLASGHFKMVIFGDSILGIHHREKINLNGRKIHIDVHHKGIYCNHKHFNSKGLKYNKTGWMEE